MRCQGEGCQESAVAHITEVADGVPTELHLCQRHTDEYLALDRRLQDQLREACAARGGG
jgi:protein-arginine kinase activator protein McsA